VHYVISYNRNLQRMTGFHAVHQSNTAMRTRIFWERENAQEGRDEEVVTIGAPDLFTLQTRHARYFERKCQHHIDSCFFCRSVLGWKERPVDMNRVELLSASAKLHGHCLLCHQAYPVWHKETYYLDEGLALHLGEECPIMNLTIDHGSVDSI
jgi:hypothetical protein